MDEITVAVTNTPGGENRSWHGTLQNRKIDGYVGKLISYDTTEQHFDFSFNLPPELDRPTVYLILNGNEYATALWPRFGSASLNVSSRTFEIRIPFLLRGAHVTEDYECISSLTCYTPILLNLFGIKPFEQRHEDDHQTSIRTNFGTATTYSSSIGAIKLWVGGSTGSSFEKIDIVFTCGFTVELKEKISITAATKMTQRVEAFISLLCFDYIHFEKVTVGIKSERAIPNTLKLIDEDPNAEIETDIHAAELFRSQRHQNSKTTLSRLNLPMRLTPEFPCAEIFEKFLSLYERIERSFSWYRTAQIEDRYLEDHFFYSVRMIEAAYQALAIKLSKNETPSALDGICQAVKDNPILAKFLKKRVEPIFTKPSLGSIVRDIRDRYREIPLTRILDEAMIGKLRNKEAHGTTERYTGDDYRYMMITRDLLVMIYPCLILEASGVNRDFLLNHLKNGPHEYAKFFSEKYASTVVD